MSGNERYRIKMRGQVQGVGFRPHVYRHAIANTICGFVFNDSDGVIIEAQGANIVSWIDALVRSLPAMAKIDSIHSTPIDVIHNETSFIIQRSSDKNAKAQISPDACVCDRCLEDIFTHGSRYYHYPFTSCCDCGPRYSILNALPYDRHNTSMLPFTLCGACDDDYKNPEDRRFHYQSMACSHCGPKLTTNIEEICRDISQGRIIALKGLGGYQIICDARNEHAVSQLRQRKMRPAKPFAVMALNVCSVESWAEVGESRDILDETSRSIVLLKRKFNYLAKSISPHTSHYGVMLPSTPLHYLLFYHLLKPQSEKNWWREPSDIVLLVTSANRSGEPLISANNEAIHELNGMVDRVISYDREILHPLDDSVIKPIANKTLYIRRARGFVPDPIPLNQELPSTIAVGGYLKNTICIVRKNEAFLSQHIGDLGSIKTINRFHDTITSMKKYLNIKPECIAYDMHPDYYSTRYAHEQSLVSVAIQHHHAHLASVVAERHIEGKVLGLALDGMGYGDDHSPWGGELLLFDAYGYERIGHFERLPLPGGDLAVKEPWRMAVTLLMTLGYHNEAKKRFSHIVQADTLIQSKRILEYSPMTTSCGRLFDAASALLGYCDYITYEGEAAMLLEAAVTVPRVYKDGWTIKNNIISFKPLIDYMIGLSKEEGANVFHGTLVEGIYSWLSSIAKKLNINTVVLSGGCFINQYITEGLLVRGREDVLLFILPERVPINDAGISLGQAWVAAHQYMNYRHTTRR